MKEINDVTEQGKNPQGENSRGANPINENRKSNNQRAFVNGMPAALAARLVSPTIQPDARPKAGRPKVVRTLDEARESVESYARDQWDTVVARQELEFQDGHLVFRDEGGAQHRLCPNTWASGQLCARLGIPSAYFHKCPVELQDAQANYWLGNPSVMVNPVGMTDHDRGKGAKRSAMSGTASNANLNSNTRWLLRANGERLRAVLSERYSPLDNPQLVECLRPLWQKHYALDWFALCEESLHLRIVDPARTRTVRRGDGLTIGVHISNSEVGLRSVCVDALVYRLVCSNGLIRLVKGKSLLRQRHIHVAQPRFVAALEEAVECAWVEAGGFLDQMERTTAIPVPEVEKTVEGIGEKWRLSEAVQSDVLASLRREPVYYQETLYGLVNAFTNAAQRLPDEGRYDLEVLAGYLAEHGANGYSNGSGHSATRGPRGSEGSRRALRNARGSITNPKSVSPEWQRSEVADEDSLGNESFDVVEATREMFDAQVVTRQSRVQDNRSGVSQA